MGGTYLDSCLALFTETMETRHGWRPDYAGLEKELEPIGLGKRELAYHDLEIIQNGRYWDFRQFWRFGEPDEIRREVDFGEISTLIQRLPLDEATSVAKLHAAFKYIENVSVILRFIHPREYGILSAPVEKILEVRRGRTEVDTYLSYVRDLREIRDHHKLARAADADMALWVLQERVLKSYRDHDLLREFRADAWMARKRAVNLLAELATVTSLDDHLALARVLVAVHLPLAGVLAGSELERRLRARSQGRGRAGLADLVERAAKADAAAGHTHEAERLRRALAVRDGFLGAGSMPTRREMLDLIEAVEWLESPDAQTS